MYRLSNSSSGRCAYKFSAMLKGLYKMNKNIIKETIKNLYDPKKYNYIGYGYKKIKNKKTNIKSFIFGVNKKIPENELNKDSIIPKYIFVDGLDIATDVVELSKASYLSGSNCYVCEDNSSNIFRDKQSPLKCGVSIGSMSLIISEIDTNELQASNIENVGSKRSTLGYIAIDNETDKLVGVSCSHGLIDNFVIASERDQSDPVGEATEYFIFQPNFIDDPNSNEIGKIKRYYPVSSDNSTSNIDACLFTVDSSDSSLISVADSFKQLGLENETPLVFASEQEIDSLIENNSEIVKIGASSGFIDCDSDLYGSNFIVTINNIEYQDCLIFNYSYTDDYPASNYICDGDSGSVIIAKFNNVYKIIGIVIAAASEPEDDEEVSNNYGIVCPMYKIANLLNIRPWLGENIQPTNTSAWSFIDINGLSNQVNIIQDNKTYWQIGTKNVEGQLKTSYVTYNADEVPEETDSESDLEDSEKDSSDYDESYYSDSTSSESDFSENDSSENDTSEQDETQDDSSEDCPCPVPEILDIQCISRLSATLFKIQLIISFIVPNATIQMQIVDKDGNIIQDFFDIAPLLSNQQILDLNIDVSTVRVYFRIKVVCDPCYNECEDCECDDYAYGDKKPWDINNCVAISSCLISNDYFMPYVEKDDKTPTPAPKLHETQDYFYIPKSLTLSLPNPCENNEYSLPEELFFEYDETSDEYEPRWILVSELNNNYTCESILDEICCENTKTIVVNGLCEKQLNVFCENSISVNGNKLKTINCNDTVIFKAKNVATINCDESLCSTGLENCLYLTLGKNQKNVSSFILNGSITKYNDFKEIMYTFPGNQSTIISIPIRIRWRKLYEDYTIVDSESTATEYSCLDENNHGLTRPSTNYKYSKNYDKCDFYPDIDYAHSSCLEPKCDESIVENLNCNETACVDNIINVINCGDTVDKLSLNIESYRKYQEKIKMILSFDNTCRSPDIRECLFGPCRNEISLESLDKTPGPCDKCYCTGGGRPIDIDYHCVSKVVKPVAADFPANTESYTLWFVPRGLSALLVIDNIIYDTSNLDPFLDIVKVHTTNTPEEMREWVCKYVRFVSVVDYSLLKIDINNAVISNWPYNDLYWETRCDTYPEEDVPINLVPC